jgi:nucleoside-diphosphate-sugar epimerase
MSADRPITVLGAGGWIGAALVAELRRQGRPVRAVDRAGLPAWLAERDSRGLSQGPVIDAIGLTADFRQRPHATAEAHVGLLSQVLQRPGIEQLLYLSSTRVYARSTDTREAAPLPCLSSDPSDLYNLSKLLGEALVLQDPRPGLKVVRLSNVVGPGQPTSTFVGALLAEARAGGVVTIQQPADTAKDYVTLADVVRLLPLIAERGQQRLYNLGRGSNTSHAEVAAWLERQGARVRFASGERASSGLSFPPLVIERLAAEFEPPADPFARFDVQIAND